MSNTLLKSSLLKDPLTNAIMQTSPIEQLCREFHFSSSRSTDKENSSLLEVNNAPFHQKKKQNASEIDQGLY